MDFLTFISSIFSAAIWPATVLVLSFLFRKSISRILDSIRLKRIKKGDFEVDFEQALSQLKEKVDILNLAPTPSQTRLTNELAPTIQAESKIENEVPAISQLNPAAGVALAWNIIERELHSTVLRLDISPIPLTKNSPIENIQLLHSAKYIDEHHIEILNRLRMLRNQAAHSMYEPIITLDEAADYATIAGEMVIFLASLKRK